MTKIKTDTIVSWEIINLYQDCYKTGLITGHYKQCYETLMKIKKISKNTNFCQKKIFLFIAEDCLPSNITNDEVKAFYEKQLKNEKLRESLINNDSYGNGYRIEYFRKYCKIIFTPSTIT